jgi:hypothetical protein
MYLGIPNWDKEVGLPPEDRVTGRPSLLGAALQADGETRGPW